ncbi:hypothetical protein, partial [Pseudomonas aeruginosa]|uniref:hypothetical protein n=1 Tax=Pseudomonas aeruginosa TaxID=287 RepID=UPI003D665EF5
PDSVEAENLRQQLPGVVPHLQQLYALYKALLAGRHVRGAIGQLQFRVALAELRQERNHPHPPQCARQVDPQAPARVGFKASSADYTPAALRNAGVR